MNKQTRYYLSKSGTVTGPYLDDDIVKLEKSGVIFSYSWIWKEGTGEWRPVDPAPTGNPEKVSVKVKEGANPAPVTGDAYCLWGSDIFKGSIVSQTALGIEFSYNDHSLVPPFAEGLGITLVSTDFENRESRAHNMKIVEIHREDSEWKLFLRHNN